MVTLIALVLVSAAFAFGFYVLGRSLAKIHREHARERQLLINQILHLSGRTWQPPPAGNGEPTETVIAAWDWDPPGPDQDVEED